MKPPVRIVAKQSLQTLMRIMGYDVDKLAVETGYSTNQIYQILAGTIDPSIQFIKRVSFLFGVVNIGEIVEIKRVPVEAPSEVEINIMFEQQGEKDDTADDR
jgi:transcriptional regulator with XRE-family HTH domain